MRTRESIRKRQSGATLQEALVAAFLLAILFLGLAFVLSRGFVSQRYLSTQSIAIMHIREALQTPNAGITEICLNDGAPPPLSLVELSVTVSHACSSLSLPGFSIGDLPQLDVEVPVITLSADSEDLFGGEIVFSTD